VVPHSLNCPRQYHPCIAPCCVQDFVPFVHNLLSLWRDVFILHLTRTIARPSAAIVSCQRVCQARQLQVVWESDSGRDSAHFSDADDLMLHDETASEEDLFRIVEKSEKRKKQKIR